MVIGGRLKDAIKYVRSRGVREFCGYAQYRVSERWHERYFGIDTEVGVELRTLGIVNPDSIDYWPTPYQAIKAAMRRIRISNTDVFIDYGSGKGRIVTVAATFPIRRVVGIELSPVLAAKARDNLIKAQNRRRCERVDVLNLDAINFALPNDATILHFFNPFHGETLRRVVAKIRESLETVPRELVILFANPMFMEQLLQIDGTIPRGWILGRDDVLFCHHDHRDPDHNRYRIYRIDSREPFIVSHSVERVR
jgi:hypothetical protein